MDTPLKHRVRGVGERGGERRRAKGVFAFFLMAFYFQLLALSLSLCVRLPFSLLVRFCGVVRADAHPHPHRPTQRQQTYAHAERKNKNQNQTKRSETKQRGRFKSTHRRDRKRHQVCDQLETERAGEREAWVPSEESQYKGSHRWQNNRRKQYIYIYIDDDDDDDAYVRAVIDKQSRLSFTGTAAHTHVHTHTHTHVAVQILSSFQKKQKDREDLTLPSNIYGTVFRAFAIAQRPQTNKQQS